MLNINHTVRVYTGKRGCMCGCLGQYKDSVRVRKLAITQLLKDPDVEFDTWAEEGCISVTTATRTRVLYLNSEGVDTVRKMGIRENQVYG